MHSKTTNTEAKNIYLFGKKPKNYVCQGIYLFGKKQPCNWVSDLSAIIYSFCNPRKMARRELLSSHLRARADSPKRTCASQWAEMIYETLTKWLNESVHTIVTMQSRLQGNACSISICPFKDKFASIANFDVTVNSHSVDVSVLRGCLRLVYEPLTSPILRTKCAVSKKVKTI